MRANIYLDDESYKLIKKACEKEERSFSNFVSVSSKKRAKKILYGDESWESN